MKWTTNAPRPGDMIRTKVSFYYHYGIYASDAEVIQFGLPDNTGIPQEEICVNATDIYGFLRGGMLETAELTRQEKAKRARPDAILERARARLGETGYDILHNNCEHFANDCMFGAPASGFLDGVRASIRQKLRGK